MQHRDGHVDGLLRPRAEKGCSRRLHESRGVDDQEVNTQVRVRLCADRSNTRRRGALFGGNRRAALFVRAELPQRRCLSSEAVEALW